MYYDCCRGLTTGNDVRQVGGWEGLISFEKSRQKTLRDVTAVLQGTIAVCHLAFSLWDIRKLLVFASLKNASVYK